MTLQQALNKAMGVRFEDVRELVTVHAPWMCECDKTDCPDMGMYMPCYHEEDSVKCPVYNKEVKQ